jgi:hypothetical protein
MHISIHTKYVLNLSTFYTLKLKCFIQNFLSHNKKRRIVTASQNLSPRNFNTEDQNKL